MVKLGQLRETDFVAVIVDVAVDATATVTLTVAATGHRDGRGRGRGHENGRVHVNDHGLRFSNWFRFKLARPQTQKAGDCNRTMSQDERTENDTVLSDLQTQTLFDALFCKQATSANTGSKAPPWPAWANPQKSRR